MNLRKHERIPVDYAGSFVGGYLRGKGVILDLSIAGCRVSSPSVVTTGDILGVLIELPGREHPLYITRTVVRWTTATEFGMEFILMDLHDRQRLDHMVLKAELFIYRALEKTESIYGFPYPPDTP
ncbi:MAG TPA: PilZ domain-containing protein [Nitrospira sp.]|nr:PilZ domain-containing protein [Nitrospira sp.]